jgi:MFS family permease
MAGMTAVFAPLSGALIGRRGGARAVLVAAACALILSALLLTRLAPSTSPGYLLLAYFIFGVGFGLVNPPITNAAVSGMPPSQAGVAAAVASTSRQVGMTLGVAVLGAVAAAGVSGPIGRSLATATHVSWWIVVGLGFAILVLALLTTTEWALDTARETASRFGEGARRDALYGSQPA